MESHLLDIWLVDDDCRRLYGMNVAQLLTMWHCMPRCDGRAMVTWCDIPVAVYTLKQFQHMRTPSATMCMHALQPSLNSFLRVGRAGSPIARGRCGSCFTYSSRVAAIPPWVAMRSHASKPLCNVLSFTPTQVCQFHQIQHDALSSTTCSNIGFGIT